MQPVCGRYLSLVCVYVPHAGRQNPSSADTIDDLDNLLLSVPRHDCLIVMGDFNAKLPRNNGRLTGRADGAYTAEQTRWMTC